MKILELNGNKYSQQEFEGYKYRAMFRFEIVGDLHHDNINIYTDDLSRTNVEAVIKSRATNRIRNVELIHWASKAQDDLSSQFIEETLKNI